jgi:gamma-glutamylcyclotransferase
MAEEIISAWVHEHRFLGPARLDGFRLLFLRRSIRWEAGAADVVPDEGAVTWGALYELSSEDLATLDTKEYTANAGYQRRDVEVETQDGARHKATTYEVVSKEAEELAPRPEYLELLIKGATQRGLPPEWIDMLKELQSRWPSD